MEIVNYHRNGRPYWLEIYISPVADTSGIVTHFVAVQLDVTERKRAEQELIEKRRFLDRVTATVPSVVYVYDLERGKLL